MYEIPSLNFRYGDLEPYFDEATLRIHHTKHHQTYADRLNVALAKHPELSDKDLVKLIQNVDGDLPEDIRTSVVNNGGGFLNHSFFWEILAKPLDEKNTPKDMAIEKLIIDHFGSYENFKTKFTEMAIGVFGSGWTYLLVGEDMKLEIVNIANQNLPPAGKTAILALDLWEHAYYLKYQNRRNEYIDAFYHVINWKKVEELLKSSGVK